MTSMVDTRRKVDIGLQAFTTTDLLNWEHHTPSFMEKPQALIDLMQLDPSSKLISPPGQTANSFFRLYLIQRSNAI
jgi:hypothetical protein